MRQSGFWGEPAVVISLMFLRPAVATQDWVKTYVPGNCSAKQTNLRQ
jgi:hypothetical protein